MQNRKAIIAGLTLAIVAGAGWIGLRYDGVGGDMTKSTERFVQALSAEQKAKAVLPFDSPKRLDWHFIPKPERKGLQIKELTAEQRKLAHAVLHSGLSQVGFEKATTIMSLEAILHELEKTRQNTMIRDTERYYFTVFGTPGLQGTWGWSVEGHHLSLNFVVRDGKLISATPAFFGANPATVQGEVAVGPKKGTQVLEQEEGLAFRFLASLNDEQRTAAVIDEKAPADLRGAGEPQAPHTAAVGLPATKMTGDQVKTIQSLLDVYAANMPNEIGGTWLAEIKKAGTDKLHFAWAGGDKPGVAHYYRVQGPSFVLEFCNSQADASNNAANHIHSVWRSMAGDFGIPAGN